MSNIVPIIMAVLMLICIITTAICIITEIVGAIRWIIDWINCRDTRTVNKRKREGYYDTHK
jgi:hypothetical protein